MAVRNDVLYFNQAVDLFTLKYDRGTNTIKLLKRNKNVFPEMTSPDGQKAYVPEDSVLINWQPIN